MTTFFGTTSYQAWLYDVTLGKNLSSLCLKSYCLLNFLESHQIFDPAAYLKEFLKKTI